MRQIQDMQKEQFGAQRPEQIPIKEIFPDEATCFTPWLAKQQNLSQLGAALYLDLEFVGREVPGGGFSLDILAEDRESGRLVAIENQLGGSDTQHFGQLLTYSAWQGADILVWIAPSFWGKHRTSLEWLNSRAPEKTELYAVEVRGTRVGQAQFIDFWPVVFPDGWLKRSKMAGSTVRNTSQEYRNFFQPLVTDLWWDGLTDNGSALYRSEQVIRTEFRDVSYIVGFGGNRKVWVYLWIAQGDKEHNKRIYEKLLVAANDIKQEVCEELCWIGQPRDRDQASFGICREGSIGQSNDELDEIRVWMAESFCKFKSAVHPHLQSAMQAADDS